MKLLLERWNNFVTEARDPLAMYAKFKSMSDPSNNASENEMQQALAHMKRLKHDNPAINFDEEPQPTHDEHDWAGPQDAQCTEHGIPAHVCASWNLEVHPTIEVFMAWLDELRAEGRYSDMFDKDPEESYYKSESGEYSDDVIERYGTDVWKDDIDNYPDRYVDPMIDILRADIHGDISSVELPHVNTRRKVLWPPTGELKTPTIPAHDDVLLHYIASSLLIDDYNESLQYILERFAGSSELEEILSKIQRTIQIEIDKQASIVSQWKGAVPVAKLKKAQARMKRLQSFQRSV